MTDAVLSQDEIDRLVAALLGDGLSDTIEQVKRMEKPPQGVAPYYIESGRRILALASAIKRYSMTGTGVDKIREWASEIILQCELQEKMRES